MCPNCQHAVSSHSEVCGCLMCRCHYVKVEDRVSNPRGKYGEAMSSVPVHLEAAQEESKEVPEVSAMAEALI